MDNRGVCNAHKEYNHREKSEAVSEMKIKNENFQCFSQFALASRQYFERTSAMLQCLADEKGPEEIKRLDALCQRDPRTQKEGHEALRVQFERTLAEGYEFHRKARGIPQASTHHMWPLSLFCLSCNCSPFRRYLLLH